MKPTSENYHSSFHESITVQRTSINQCPALPTRTSETIPLSCSPERWLPPIGNTGSGNAHKQTKAYSRDAAWEINVSIERVRLIGKSPATHSHHLNTDKRRESRPEWEGLSPARGSPRPPQKRRRCHGHGHRCGRRRGDNAPLA